MKHPTLTFVIFALMLAGCASVNTGTSIINNDNPPRKSAETQMPSERINWPENYEPSKSKFYISNEIEVKASPKTVWNILIDAPSWSSYYKGATEVQLLDQQQTRLEANSQFAWKTMGLRFTSVIKEYEPYKRLSWESKRRDIQGYHAWLIIPTEEGSKIITEESQNG